MNERTARRQQPSGRFCVVRGNKSVSGGKVEITFASIVERKELSPWHQHIKDEALVPVRIAYGETELGGMARRLGGKWAADIKLWSIEYGKIKGPDLEKHMILDASTKDKVS